MIEKLQRLKEIKDLRAKIEACRNDKQAILLQSQLVDLLRETFQDKELMVDLLMKTDLKNKK